MECISPDFLVMSPDYSGTMSSVVLPFLRDREKQATLTAPDGTALYCVTYCADHPAGSVLVLHGFTENAFKYSEIIYSLVRSGFSVVAYDQRGHGRSGRSPCISDSSVTHVEHFDDYVSDLKMVVDRLLAPMPEPHMIFAHSMGGAVAALFLEKYPDVFRAALLCAPMIAPSTRGFSVPAARAVCLAAKLAGRGRRHPFFMKPWSGPEDFSTSCATDPARFAWYDEIKTSREEFRNSIPTYNWTLESLGVTGRILAPGAPEKITCPVLLCSADKDYSVMPEPQKSFIGRVPHGKQIFVRNSRHEIFRSVNDVFFPWWHQVLEFFRINLEG
ncbi:MAG: alpha/beta hydrolase [Clostridia bacterium]|nr:alpha/beta hydrolase [Clostridia bacterium]